MNLSAPISSIMTENVECVSPNDKLLTVKHIYEQKKFHHHIPVTEDDKLVGIVSLVDFMRHIHNATLDDHEAVYNKDVVQDIMTLGPTTVSPDTSIKEVAEQLAKGEFHALVITVNNSVKGIISTADLIRYFLKSQ